MSKMTSEAVTLILTENGQSENFCDLFALKSLFETGIIDQDYTVSQDLSDIISLTEHGSTVYNSIINKFPEISPNDALLATFISFENHDLYVDIENCSINGLVAFLNDEIIAKKIRFPWVFETTLYNRYFDLGFGRRSKLDLIETYKLINDTPCGVFQLRSFIVGPFGVIKSNSLRGLRPTRKVPVWHCPDQACTSLHSVLLATGDNKIRLAYQFVEINENKKSKERSGWSIYYYDRIGGAKWYEDYHLDPLPWLLANAFSVNELRAILEELINQKSKTIRERFPQNKIFAKVFIGSASSISERLSKPECLQIILLEDNVTIANIAEKLIRNNRIAIPWNEIRNAQFSMDAPSWHDISLQCSKFGIRSISRQENRSITRLLDLIKTAYSEKSDLSQLDWILRNSKGDTTLTKLSEFIHDEDPLKILSEMVFNSPKNFSHAISHLKYGDFSHDQSQTGELNNKHKILWKLGFEIYQHPKYQSQFWERYDAFLTSCRTYSEYSELEREAIRSTAVNFFVSLEEILDLSVSFAGWVLLSDHYVDTRFVWNYEANRSGVYKNLNISQADSDSKIDFDESGKNTLYPLTKGFEIISQVIDRMLTGNTDKHKRQANEMPGFAKAGENITFPFLHKPIVFDVKTGDLVKIISLLRETTLELDKSNLCNIRNRLEHRRNDFPSQSEIEHMCEAVSKCIRKLEVSGICPVVYIKDVTTVDAYGRRKVVMKDYKKRPEIVRLPSDYIQSRLPATSKPLIIVPWLTLGESKEKLRFYIQENSDFISIWNDYPKRRYNDSTVPNIDEESSSN